MTDILFYHLERQPLEKVIPSLLEKTLERGWRAVIRAKSAEKVQLLDEELSAACRHGGTECRH